MMEEGEQEKRGEGVKQQEGDGEVTGTGGQEGGEAEIEKLNISSPKEEQDEARKSSVEQEMERWILSKDKSTMQISNNFIRFQVFEI